MATALRPTIRSLWAGEENDFVSLVNSIGFEPLTQEVESNMVSVVQM